MIIPDKSSMPCGLMEGVENGFVNYSFSGSTASYECEMDGYTLMDIGAVRKFLYETIYLDFCILKNER